MAKKGLLMCVCQGTCPSFKEMDIFEVLNTIRREKLVDFVALHPQLCADDGDEFFKVLDYNEIDRLYIAGCDPRMQQKMFGYAFKEKGFNPTHHLAVDIRNMTTEQAIEAIKKIIEQG